MEMGADAAAPADGPAAASGQVRVGESVLQRLGRSVAPACASVVGVLGLALLGVLGAGPASLGLGAFRLEALNLLVIVMLVLAAQSLWLLVERRQGTVGQVLANLLAALVLAMAALRLLLFTGVLTVTALADALPPGLLQLLPMIYGMTADAALCFALVSIGLLTMNLWPALRYPPAQVAALALGMLALSSFVTYGYGLIAVVWVGPFELMPLPVSVGLMALAVGLLFSRPRRGIARIILSDTAGGESARWLLPVAVLIPVLLGALRLEGERLGWFSPAAGTVLLVMALIVLLLAMIWWNSSLLFNADVQRETIRQRLHYQSRHDALTGLANRPHFLQRLEAEAQRARRHHVPCALLYMDLDGFKQVNDTLGHPTGDELLQAVAGRLRGCVRDDRDLVARLGGDEFVVLLEDSPPKRAYEVAGRILSAVSEPYRLDGQDVTVGISIGMAFGDDRTESAETLLKAADLALYAAKHGGKGRVHPPEDASGAPSRGRRSTD